MNLYQTIKDNWDSSSEKSMWATVEVLSEYLEQQDEEEKEEVLKKVYEAMTDGHFNQHFAEEQISKMMFTDLKGEVKTGPFFSMDTIKAIYDQIKDTIKPYNVWDFAVTMNMIKSDNEVLFRKWWTSISEADLQQKIIEASVNWLDDPDYTPMNKKAWSYFNH